MPLTADLVTDRCTRAVPQVRAYVTEMLRCWDCPTAVVDDAALLVTELVTNAVRHGGGPTIRVHTRREDHQVRCQIHDDGAEGPLPTCRAVGSLAEHGRGLDLVDALATRWGSHTDPDLVSGRRVVWFELAAPEPGPPQAETDPDVLRRVLDALRRL